MKLAKTTLAAGSLVLLIFSATADAQFKLPSALGGSSPTSSGANASAGADASISSDSLVRTFVASNKEILTAQSLLELAYGNKTKAQELQNESDALKSGGVDKAQLEKVVDLSNQASEELTAKQAQQTKFSAEEKQYYVQSLPHFAKGVVGTRQLVADVTKFGSNAKGSMMGGGMSALSGGFGKMKAGLYVAKATPGYSKNVFNTFRKTVSIAQSNDVKVPADATQALTGP